MEFKSLHPGVTLEQYQEIINNAFREVMFHQYNHFDALKCQIKSDMEKIKERHYQTFRNQALVIERYKIKMKDLEERISVLEMEKWTR